jgi:hypothetical protein
MTVTELIFMKLIRAQQICKENLYSNSIPNIIGKNKRFGRR